MPDSENKQPKNEKQRRPLSRPVMILLVTTFILMIFVFVALLLLPGEIIPEFSITDRKGSWESQGTIAVFDEKIKPGSEGEYSFILKSETADCPLRYGIRFHEYLSNEIEGAEKFMQYRLKLDGVNIDSDDTGWHYVNELDYYDIIILPGTEHLFTLEWRWPFEIGKDDNDTLIGRVGGKYSLVFYAWAEVMEEWKW